jgi:ABC-type nitrate/sulfonate/bicarbonate transport system ATPase subunit
MTPRPGRIASEIRVDLGRPRDAELLRKQEFYGYVTAVSDALEAAVADVAG